ncbi:MAG: hypothetical protein ACYC1L_01070 [Alphaproteobacteria bacterium]
MAERSPNQKIAQATAKAIGLPAMCEVREAKRVNASRRRPDFSAIF